jgi:sugar phosphate isomerase/epimerase
MQLGFVSAILGELPLDDVLTFAANERIACVELMCWPPGGADRRYAGVTHLDVSNFNDKQAEKVRELIAKFKVSISGLGYYPNPLDPDDKMRSTVVAHLKKVIAAAGKLGVKVVNTFIGRDPTRTVEANWPMLRSIWPELIRLAEVSNVNLAIENCPMLFTLDEWPAGKNLAISPAVWRKLFGEFSSTHIGLNFDPSHLVWQHIDYTRAIREFGKRIFHVHAKDARVDADRLYEQGTMGLGWHTPKLPGLGDVDWGKFFSALTDTGYKGAVCIEVEDRAFEGSLDDRKRALRQSKRYLERYM